MAVSTEGQTTPPTGVVTPPLPPPPNPEQQAREDAVRGNDLTRRHGDAASIADRRDGVAFKAHGSQRGARVAYEDPVGDFAKDAAEAGGTVVATWLLGEAGAVLALGAVSGGGQMLGGILSGNSDDVREGAKGVLVAVAAEVTLTVVSEALAEIEAGDADGKTYQTYTKTNAETGEVYTGRTSGTASALENVGERDRNHHMNQKGFGPASFDRSSASKDAIRGREQHIIDANGGAKSTGGSSGNSINAIDSKNPQRQRYLDAATKEFGKP